MSRADRQRRQPQESRSQEPQGVEAPGPRDSRAGPACSGSPGPRACTAGLRGDKQELRGRTWRRPTTRPCCKGGGGGGPHPTSQGTPPPLCLGTGVGGEPGALEGWGRRCGLSVRDVSAGSGADPGPKPARLPRQQALKGRGQGARRLPARMGRRGSLRADQPAGLHAEPGLALRHSPRVNRWVSSFAFYCLCTQAVPGLG